VAGLVVAMATAMRGWEASRLTYLGHGWRVAGVTDYCYRTGLSCSGVG
jgi:hypothetical protein